MGQSSAIGGGELQGCWPGYPTYPNPNTYPNVYTTWTVTKEVPIKMELYEENLVTLSRALTYVDEVLDEEGVVEVEIRIKMNDSKAWAVLGYGESGDPCILRFEKD